MDSLVDSFVCCSSRRPWMNDISTCKNTIKRIPQKKKVSHWGLRKTSNENIFLAKRSCQWWPILAQNSTRYSLLLTCSPHSETGLPSHQVSNGVQNIANGIHVRYKIFLNGVHKFSENSGQYWKKITVEKISSCERVYIDLFSCKKWLKILFFP